MITAIAVITLCSVAVVISYFVGLADGIARGRNEQWIEDYFDNLKKLRALRDELGRFTQKKKSKNEKHTP